MKMKHLLLLLLVCFGLVHFVNARYTPPFDLDYCVGEAKVIVQGNLDPQGDVEIVDALRKQAELPSKLKLYAGDSEYKYLQKLMGGSGPLEVIVFLSEDNTLGWRFVQYSPAIVGFKDSEVYLFEDNVFGASLTKSKRYDRTSFLTATKDAMKRKDEREHLAALPRSVERTVQLINFALRNDQREEDKKSPMFYAGGYELGQIAKALNETSRQEEDTILHALRTKKTPSEQIVLLNLVEGIPLKDEAMDVVAAYLPRTNAPHVREAAMNALHRINGYKAVDYLVPYLVFDDPQLANVLQNFGSQSYPPQDQLLNIHAVDALKKLAESMTGPDEIPVENGYESGAVSGQLAHYLHPKLLPILYNRALHDTSSNSAQVFSNFRSALGLKYTQDDKSSWEMWWREAQPMLEGNFDLQTRTGRDLWMDHYAHADVATQKILMNLWFFETNVDEAALIDSAEKNETAKQVLSELWKRERISERGKQMIIKKW